MSPEDDAPKIHIDSDWKQEAQREKETLAEQEERSSAAGERQRLPDAASFLHVVNLLAMQAVVGLGGMQGPGGQAIPADPEVARFHIDMLELLQEKTKGNLTEEETKTLSATLHELRMMYVQVTSAMPQGKG